MIVDDKHDGKGGQTYSITVWDPLVRLIHWCLALTILLNGAIVEDEGALHEWIGYVALCLVAIRLVWGLVGSRHARFSAFPPNPFKAVRYFKALLKGDDTVYLSHNPFGSLMVYNIWATVLLIGLTGYMMGTMAYFGVEWVEEAHEIAFNWLVLSVILHISGVVYDSRHSGVSLVKAMISGEKVIEKDKPLL